MARRDAWYVFNYKAYMRGGATEKEDFTQDEIITLHKLLDADVQPKLYHLENIGKPQTYGKSLAVVDDSQDLYKKVKRTDVEEKEETKKFLIESTRDIIIDPLAYKKMLYFTQAATGEISGFGKVLPVSVHKNYFKGYESINKYMITDVKIFKQKCSSGGTTLDGKSLARFIVDLVKAGEKPEEWSLWWHSHNDFGVFFSGTDTGTIAALSPETLLVSVCINKEGQLIGRVDDFGQYYEGNVSVMPSEDKNLREQCIKQVKEDVTNEKWNVHYQASGFGGFKRAKRWASRYRGRRRHR